MITATAQKTYTLTTDAPDAKALIQFADSLATEQGEGLDSLDLGDALGFFVAHLESGNWEALDGTVYPNIDSNDDNMLVAPAGFTVTISQKWELYQWQGIDGMQTAFNPDELGL